jgi:hypothetical protein
MNPDLVRWAARGWVFRSLNGLSESMVEKYTCERHRGKVAGFKFACPSSPVLTYPGRRGFF